MATRLSSRSVSRTFGFVWPAEGPDREEASVCLFMYVRARVRAPAMEVVGVAVREEAVVVRRREERDAKRASEIRRKGRYLFASSVACLVFERGRDGCVPFRLLLLFFFCGGGAVSDGPSSISTSESSL